MDFSEIWSPKDKKDKSGSYNRFLKFVNINHKCNFEIEETLEEKVEKMQEETLQLKIKSKNNIDEIMEINRKLLKENDEIKSKLKKHGEEFDDEDISIIKFREKYKLRTIDIKSYSSPMFIEPTSPSEMIIKNSSQYVC
jgi:hypothetical protein